MSTKETMYLLTDDEYNATGSVALEGDRYVGRDTSGNVLFSLQDYDGMLCAAARRGRIVTSTLFGMRDLAYYRPELYAPVHWLNRAGSPPSRR